MKLETDLARAQAALLMAQQACEHFMENLRQRYDAPKGEWTIREWAEGFVRIEGGENADNPPV